MSSKWLALITASFLLLSCNNSHLTTRQNLNNAPKLMLWAWERPENLSYLNDASIGIAFYAGTIYLTADTYCFKPRLQPLTVPSGTYLETVVRIENTTKDSPQLSANTMQKLLSTITSIATRPNIKSIQIDYDAKANDRHFHRDLLSKLRSTLPPEIPLSMTALASWCLGDEWFTDMPVDEIVPMFFEMGGDNQPIFSYIKSAKLKRHQIRRLQKCIGLSVKEPAITDILKEKIKNCPRRIYFFNPRAWHINTVEIAKEEAKIWL